MSSRPGLALAFYPEAAGLFVTDAQLEALSQWCEILDPTPVGSWDEPGAVDLERVEILLGHWGMPTLDEAAVARLPNLRMLAYAAGSLRGAWPNPPVVSDAAWDRGLIVTTGASANARPVAEYTTAAILLANKDAFGARERLRPGADKTLWHDRSLTVGNLGKRVGLVGASRIGRLVVELLRPFELEVVVADPYLTDDAAAELGVLRLDLDELVATSHVVSLHAPSLPETHHLIDATRLATLRDGAVLINTARGALVDQEALVAELRTGRISAVLDVTEPERLARDHPLRTLPNVFLTPHIAGSGGTEVRRLADHAIEEIRRFVAGEPPLDPVRREDLERMA